MGAFEHVISLLSFVYALAIAHLLTTAAKLLTNRGRVVFSWLHAFWMLNAMLVLVIDWISFWDMRTINTWSMTSIGLVLAASFADYLQAALVCPEIPAEGTIDLQAFHARQSRTYIGAFVGSAMMALISNIYYSGNFNVAEYAAQNVAVIPLLVVAIAAAVFRTRWVQIASPFFLTAIWVFYLVDLQGALH
jgi:hypothetical protein